MALKLKQKSKGFTLLEVMIALAIFASAAAVVAMSGSTGVRQAAYLEDKILAGWVAENYLNQLKLSRDWPDTGDKQASVRFAERDWQVIAEIKTTGQDGFRRVEVAVIPEQGGSVNKERSLYRMIGFLRKQSE
ncbi:type II secretion system minor pseudopilin GspI [Zooshikella marina]|nr:type II secretion system minor pseudopilin GspI [Zooshikella ganghwensis]MBU2704404.1 type II secretion system minor pseudopilin GspI [Zooshikella ganghwensis]